MIKYSDDVYPTDNFRWKILDKKKAEKLKIEVVNIDNEASLLLIDATTVPKKMSMDKYIEDLQRKKIVINDVKKKETPQRRRY